MSAFLSSSLHFKSSQIFKLCSILTIGVVLIFVSFYSFYKKEIFQNDEYFRFFFSFLVFSEGNRFLGIVDGNKGIQSL